MITLFNAQLLDISVNSSALANTVGANGQFSYNYETGQIYIHDGYGNKFFSNTIPSISTGTQAQGSVSGYASGGYIIGDTESNVIDKFPFSSDSNASDVGNLSQTRTGVTGQSSSIAGYSSGGFSYTPPQPLFDTIDKFSFSSDGNATDVGNLTQARWVPSGQSSDTNGYTSGGGAPTGVNVIDKFPFATNANAADVGDLTQNRSDVAGQSSITHGYSSGGVNPSVTSNVIDKFPFSANANATDVGDLTQARTRVSGQSSADSGYTSGGISSNIIDKFTFSSDGNATDVGDLTVARYSASGQSSTTHGYASGGQPSGNVIDKFPFSANGNSTDVGDLTVSRYQIAGQQV